MQHTIHHMRKRKEGVEQLKRKQEHEAKMKAQRVEALRLQIGQRESNHVTDMGLSYNAEGRIMKVEKVDADGLKKFDPASKNRMQVIEVESMAEVEMTAIYKEMKIQLDDYKMRKNQETPKGTTTSSARGSR